MFLGESYMDAIGSVLFVEQHPEEDRVCAGVGKLGDLKHTATEHSHSQHSHSTQSQYTVTAHSLSHSHSTQSQYTVTAHSLSTPSQHTVSVTVTASAGSKKKRQYLQHRG